MSSPPDPKAVEESLDMLSNLRQHRLDGWMNLVTGLGTDKDKRKHSEFSTPSGVDYGKARDLVRFNSFARKVAYRRVDDALREGWTTSVANDAPLSEEIDHTVKNLDFPSALLRAQRFMRWSGGGAIYVGINKGKTSLQELASPLDESKIRSIDFLTVFSADQLRAVSYYSDLLYPKYGQPASYRVYPQISASSSTGGKPGPSTTSFGAMFGAPANPFGITGGPWPEIHESRLIVCEGPVADHRQRFERFGWGDTCFDLGIEQIQDLDEAFDAVAVGLQEFSTAVLKFSGLAQILQAGGGAESKLRSRLNAIQLGKSMCRAVVLNKGDASGNGEESLERSNIPFTGIHDVLTMFMSRFAGAYDYPVTLLFGQSPKGLGNEGDSDLISYYDSVRQDQKHNIYPCVKKFIKMLLLSKSGPTSGKLPEDWDISFKALHKQTEKEKADCRLISAQTDQILVDIEEMSPAELRKSHFTGDGFAEEVQLDDDLFKAYLADKKDKVEKARAAIAPDVVPEENSQF